MAVATATTAGAFMKVDPLVNMESANRETMKLIVIPPEEFMTAQAPYTFLQSKVRERLEQLAAIEGVHVKVTRKPAKVLRDLLSQLPELWGDHVINGKVVFVVDADVIDEALKVVGDMP